MRAVPLRQLSFVALIDFISGEWVSEQFLDGTSAHNRPFQCHTSPEIKLTKINYTRVIFYLNVVN